VALVAESAPKYQSFNRLETTRTVWRKRPIFGQRTVHNPYYAAREAASLAISYDEAKDLHSILERKHSRRHEELNALRRYWQGDYWGDGTTTVPASPRSPSFSVT
jgi:hypothetical protein